VAAGGLNVWDDIVLCGIGPPIGGEGRKAGALSEVGEGRGDGRLIVEHWAVVDIVRGPIETLVAGPR